MYRLVCPVLFGSSARAWREACRRPAWRRRKHCCQSSVRACSEPKRQRQGERVTRCTMSSAGPAFRARGACGVEKTVARAREHQPSGGGQVLRNDSANLPASGWLVVFVLRALACGRGERTEWRQWVASADAGVGAAVSLSVRECPSPPPRHSGRARGPAILRDCSEISSAIDRACCHVGAELSGINSALSSVRALRRWGQSSVMFASEVCPAAGDQLRRVSLAHLHHFDSFSTRS